MPNVFLERTINFYKMKKKLGSLVFFLLVIATAVGQSVKINNNIKEKTVVFGNGKILMTLNYNNKATISSMLINKQQLVDANSGIYSKITTKEALYSTLHLLSTPSIKTTANTIKLSN